MQVTVTVVKRNGHRQGLDRQKVYRAALRACSGLMDVDPDLLAEDVLGSLYEGVSAPEVGKALVLAARARIEAEPNYSYVAARLLLFSLYREAFGHRLDGHSLQADYRAAFAANLHALVGAGRIDPALIEKFDMGLLSRSLRPERDLLLKYMGVQTLYDRYLQATPQGRRLETPQAFWMRVAMGLCLAEGDPNRSACEAYEMFSTLRSCPATPTLLNSGTTRPQLSSCFLVSMEDSIDGIYGTLHQLARLSKHAGGLGTDVTPLRGTGSRIRGKGRCGGLVPWLRQHNDLVLAVNQEGVRKGAEAVFLEPWHIDFPDYLDLKRNTGDERRRCHDLHTAGWVPDLFFKQVKADGPWFLFSPDEVPDLHGSFGADFEARYLGHVERARRGEVGIFREVRAKDLWKKWLAALKDTGHPWVTFKDAFNGRYSNQHCGVIHSSNLCLEIGLHTTATKYSEGEVVERGETAVCTLASINLAAHADPQGRLDLPALARTVAAQIRLLDNAIDQNYYPVPEARNSHLRHRPVGLGLMGWADLLHLRGLSFDSESAIELADELQEFISWHAVLASAALARERGPYQSYGGSLWSRGKMPIDTYVEFMALSRGGLGVGPQALCRRDWGPVRDAVLRWGMRNSNVMAIAPTVTISSIAGCSPSVEPNYSALYVSETLSGDFTVSSEHLVRELKARGLWGPRTAARLKEADGDVSRLSPPLPAGLAGRYKTAFDVDQRQLIRAAAARQKWIDQAQSVNLYYAGDSMKELSELYLLAWGCGLKSTYYLHARAASRAEKSTCGPDACEACQ